MPGLWRWTPFLTLLLVLLAPRLSVPPAWAVPSGVSPSRQTGPPKSSLPAGALSRSVFKVRSGNGLPEQPVVLSLDRRLLVTRVNDKTFRLRELATGKELLTLESSAPPFAFAPKGNGLAWVRELPRGYRTIYLSEGGRVRLLSRRAHTADLVTGLLFTPDGKTLIVGCDDGRIRFWDIATGKLRKALQFPGDRVHALAGSRDGRFLASGARQGGAGRYPVIVWDAARGKRLFQVLANRWPVQALAFSPDSRLVAGQVAEGVVQVWEVASGEPLAGAHHRAGRGPVLFAFSPDSTLLATTRQVEGRGTVLLWDAPAGGLVRRGVGDVGQYCLLAFAEDGKTLTSVMPDGRALVWDATRPAGKKAARGARLGQAELNRHWSALHSRDAYTAYQAIRALAQAPEQAMTLIRQRVKPAPELDQKRIPQLIADLAHKERSVRQTAVKDLRQLGPRADVALRRVLLIGGAPAQVRRQVEDLLELAGTVRSPEGLTRARAIALLERIGSREARAALAVLAKGASAAYETQDAQATLNRLTRDR